MSHPGRCGHGRGHPGYCSDGKEGLPNEYRTQSWRHISLPAPHANMDDDSCSVEHPSEITHTHTYIHVDVYTCE